MPENKITIRKTVDNHHSWQDITTNENPENYCKNLLKIDSELSKNGHGDIANLLRTAIFHYQTSINWEAIEAVYYRDFPEERPTQSNNVMG